jgi:cytochrome c oxidase assembly factor CtaG
MPDRPAHDTRTIAFLSAFAMLALALLGPVGERSTRELSWHMIQHVMLISVVAPLLALGRPWSLVVDAFPQLKRVSQWRVGDNVAATLTALSAVGVLFCWHLPAAYDLALRERAVHILEHATLLASSMLFWGALIRARRLGAGVLWLYAVTLPMTGLGLAMTLSSTPWYSPYVSDSRLAALRDQQMAGVIMWAFGGIAAVIGAVTFFAVWLRQAGAPPLTTDVSAAS